MSDEPSAAANSPGTAKRTDDGAGCMPGFLAAMALLGIAGFICCGVSTWWLYTKRSELAIRTLRQTYIPELEQSRLAPEDKKQTVELLNQFADDLERGKYEDWQAAGVMQRLIRLPVLQWGELTAIERFIESHPEDFQPDDAFQITRVRLGVQSDKVTTIDVEDILSPVVQTDASSQLNRSLVEPLDVTAVQDVVVRCRLVADRSDVPMEPQSDAAFTEPAISEIVKRQIKAGIDSGSL
ncbi:hypothetical protein [Stieleria varia]|uniref:Uncharacterized protein n=1 Tax=Stieleria varia TaxID=2528005 RepID=A0A5C6B696_9BACT|nr:hypothetical protein [Stieleria varia]TWU06034.1 hypothetical protein Pla52n_17520 [Stieleria varia]